LKIGSRRLLLRYTTVIMRGGILADCLMITTQMRTLLRIACTRRQQPSETVS